MSAWAGYVLVGGKSSRMGRNKALLPFRGSTLVDSVAGAVRGAAGDVTLAGGTALPDLYPGEGPLGGILTILSYSALRHPPADWNLVVACDMPGLTAGFLCKIRDAAERCGGDALVPVGPSGHLEPLCAVYHRRALPGLQAAFDRGVRKMSTALAEIRMVTWAAPEVSFFQNVNTPEDWAAYDR